MEKVVSQGTNRLEIKRRRNRIYRFENDVMEGPSPKTADKKSRTTARSAAVDKESSRSGTSLPASFPTHLNFYHPYRQLLMAVKTKPFLLITGMCGSGKSRFARTLAYQTCPEYLRENGKPGNFELLAVQPSWHDNEEILGWRNRKGVFQVTRFLHFLVKAWRHPLVPFILCLDEMNLARTEHYFADFLSIMDSRQYINGKPVSDPFITEAKLKEFTEMDPGMWGRFGISFHQELQQFFLANGIMLPPNLIVIGTANVDEAGHQFSMKVLDRVMVVELNDIDLYGGIKTPDTDLVFPATAMHRDCLFGEFFRGEDAYFSSPADGDFIISELQAIDNILSGSPFRFGYRIRDAALIYCAYNARLDRNSEGNDWLHTCVDEIILMKILPRISGIYRSSEKVIDELLYFTEKKYHRSFLRLSYMKNNAENADFVSFWY